MSKTRVHYNMDNLASKGCTYNMIYGAKADGKSFQLKHKVGIYKYFNLDKDGQPLNIMSYKKMIAEGFISKYYENIPFDEYIKTKHRFGLMYRWKTEINATRVEKYFADVNIEQISGGIYNGIDYWRGRVYLVKIDKKEDGTFKKQKGDFFAYIFALNIEQQYSGGEYDDIDDLIYEEFMARGGYVPKEPLKLETLYNTLDRKNNRIKVWMAGNTVTRINPFINYWNIQDEIRKQKQGTIFTKLFPVLDEDGDIKRDDDGNELYQTLACEYTQIFGGAGLTLSGGAGILTSGAWQTEAQPHLPKSYKKYRKRFRMIFMYQSFKFIAELLQDKENKNITCWFVYPKYSEIKKGSLVFSDKIVPGAMYQRNIYDSTFKDRNIRNLLDSFRESKIFYADDRTGTDFKQAIDFVIKK